MIEANQEPLPHLATISAAESAECRLMSREGECRLAASSEVIPFASIL